jgi:hypothetical protein
LLVGVEVPFSTSHVKVRSPAWLVMARLMGELVLFPVLPLWTRSVPEHITIWLTRMCGANDVVHVTVTVWLPVTVSAPAQTITLKNASLLDVPETRLRESVPTVTEFTVTALV